MACVDKRCRALTSGVSALTSGVSAVGTWLQQCRGDHRAKAAAQSVRGLQVARARGWTSRLSSVGYSRAGSSRQGWPDPIVIMMGRAMRAL